MNIQIVTLGRGTQSFIRDGEAEYSKRLSRWVQVKFRELDTSRWSAASAEEQLSKDYGLFTTKVSDFSKVIVLDPRGEAVTSEKFAQLLRRITAAGSSEVVFAIGGSCGWDKRAISEANKVISLSALTYTHQMTRLILVEQLYRAFCINNGVTYHK